MLQKLSIIPIMLAFLILGGCGSNRESITVVTEFDLSVASSIKILQELRGTGDCYKTQKTQ